MFVFVEYISYTDVLPGHYTSILKLLVSEFTLAESGANTTTSLLRTMCHADDSIILGTWLHHTHHKAIEDQVGIIIPCVYFYATFIYLDIMIR